MSAYIAGGSANEEEHLRCQRLVVLLDQFVLNVTALARPARAFALESTWMTSS